MCDKNHLVRCWFKSHNSSKVHQKSVQSGAAFQAISCQKHEVNIKKSQWMRVSGECFFGKTYILDQS